MANDWVLRIIFAGIGLWIGVSIRQAPKKEIETVIQQQACKAQIVKTTKPDGSKEERLEVSSNQHQSIIPTEMKAPDDGLFLGGGTDFKAGISLKFGDHLHSIDSDGKEHIYRYKWKVLSF